MVDTPKPKWHEVRAVAITMVLRKERQRISGLWTESKYIIIIEIVKQGKPYVLLQVGRLRERYNAQKAEEVGKSESLCVMQWIWIQTLSRPKGSRLPTRIYLHEGIGAYEWNYVQRHD